jgi:hypothetical protein
MLGFDAYNKTMFSAIVQQRIELFLAKRIVINLPLVIKAKVDNDTIFLSEFTKTLYPIFKNQLKEKNLYFHYALASIFIEDPDYNFIISNDQDTIQKAETTLEEYFNKIAKDVILQQNSSLVSPETEKKNLFSFLLSTTENHRFIPSFTPEGEKQIRKWTEVGADLLQIKESKRIPPVIAKALGDKAYQQSLDDALRFSQPISKINSPFYIEYFYRPADYAKVRNDLALQAIGVYSKEAKEAELSTLATLKYGGYLDARLSDYKNKLNRGVRLMFNIGATIQQDIEVDANTASTVYYHPIRPTKFTPLTGFTGFDKTFEEDAESLAVPFLAKYDIISGSNNDGSFLNGIVIKMAAVESSNRNKLKADKANRPDADEKLNQNNIFSLKNDLYLTCPSTENKKTGKGKSVYDVNKNYYSAYKDLYKNVNLEGIRANKNLISFEKEIITYFKNQDGEGATEEWINCYFPIIIAEYVDEDTEIGAFEVKLPAATGQMPDLLIESKNFEPLYKKMLEEEMGQIKFLNEYINKQETAKKLFGEDVVNIQNIVEANEKNIKIFESFQKENDAQEALFNSLPEVVQDILFPGGFKTPKPQFVKVGQFENDLDKTLFNLITFDEEK